MNRYTEKTANGNYQIQTKNLEYWSILKDNPTLNTTFSGDFVNKLAKFENLEEKLEKIYGGQGEIDIFAIIESVFEKQNAQKPHYGKVDIFENNIPYYTYPDCGKKLLWD